MLYCGSACQKADWRAHKPACGAGQALPFLRSEEVRPKLWLIAAQHRRAASFQLRAAPLDEVDKYEQRITLRHGMPNVLAAMISGTLEMIKVGVMACVEERDGAWLPFLKVGDPSIHGAVQMRCLNLGVDPSLSTILAADAAFQRQNAAGRDSAPPCPVYYSSRWEMYMHC